MWRGLKHDVLSVPLGELPFSASQTLKAAENEACLSICSLLELGMYGESVFEDGAEVNKRNGTEWNKL